MISETFTYCRTFQCLPSPVEQADAVDVQTPSNTMFGWVIYSAALADCKDTTTPLLKGASLCPQRQHYWVLGEKEATLVTSIPYTFFQQAGISCSSPTKAKNWFHSPGRFHSPGTTQTISDGTQSLLFPCRS